MLLFGNSSEVERLTRVFQTYQLQTSDTHHGIPHTSDMIIAIKNRDVIFGSGNIYPDPPVGRAPLHFSTHAKTVADRLCPESKTLDKFEWVRRTLMFIVKMSRRLWIVSDKSGADVELAWLRSDLDVCMPFSNRSCLVMGFQLAANYACQVHHVASIPAVISPNDFVFGIVTPLSNASIFRMSSVPITDLLMLPNVVFGTLEHIYETILVLEYFLGVRFSRRNTVPYTGNTMKSAVYSSVVDVLLDRFQRLRRLEEQVVELDYQTWL